MSVGIVHEFCKRLAKDRDLYERLLHSQSKAECSAIAKAEGYDFTQDELATYTTMVLESKSLETKSAELQPLESHELEAIIGGAMTLLASDFPLPPYGHSPPGDRELV